MYWLLTLCTIVLTIPINLPARRSRDRGTLGSLATGAWREASIPPYSQRIGHAVDVVEPGGDQRDLEDGAIVEAGGSQVVMILRRDLGRVFRQLDDIVDHGALGRGDRRLRIIFPQRLDEMVVQGNPTQKLCVRDNSVMALVGERDHRGDHLVLPALERQVGRHQRAER